jgi:hypothetical protein
MSPKVRLLRDLARILAITTGLAIACSDKGNNPKPVKDLVYIYGTSSSIVHGDMDNDGQYTAMDLGWMFAGGPPPVLQDCVADMDCDGNPTALDLGSLIDILYAGVPLPPPCFVYW